MQSVNVLSCASHLNGMKLFEYKGVTLKSNIYV